VFEQTGVNVDQFYGIEVEDFPAQIAQVAMWLADHQMNLGAGQFFGNWIKRIPLDKSAEIRHGNALRIEWADFCPPGKPNYILGNPPFIGKQNQSASQKEDMEFVTKGIKNAGLLDYVSGWNLKAAQYIAGSQLGEVSRDRKQFADVKFAADKTSKKAVGAGTDEMFVIFDKQDAANRFKVCCAFVSTNSIAQGSRLAYCGASCCAWACTSSLLTARFNGLMTRRVRPQCIASLLVLALTMRWPSKFGTTTIFKAKLWLAMPRTSTRISWIP